jgi:hypothetical protein
MVSASWPLVPWTYGITHLRRKNSKDKWINWIESRILQHITTMAGWLLCKWETVGYMSNSQSPCDPCSWPISISISTNDLAIGWLTLIAFSLHAQNLAATLCLVHGWTGDRGEGSYPIPVDLLQSTCVDDAALPSFFSPYVWTSIEVPLCCALHQIVLYDYFLDVDYIDYAHSAKSSAAPRAVGRYNLWSSTCKRSCFYVVINLC